MASSAYLEGSPDFPGFPSLHPALKAERRYGRAERNGSVRTIRTNFSTARTMTLTVPGRLRLSKSAPMYAPKSQRSTCDPPSIHRATPHGAATRRHGSATSLTPVRPHRRSRRAHPAPAARERLRGSGPATRRTTTGPARVPRVGQSQGPMGTASRAVTCSVQPSPVRPQESAGDCGVVVARSGRGPRVLRVRSSHSRGVVEVRSARDGDAVVASDEVRSVRVWPPIAGDSGDRADNVRREMQCDHKASPLGRIRMISRRSRDVMLLTTPGISQEIRVLKSAMEFANGRSLVTVLGARSLVHPPSPATGRFHARLTPRLTHGAGGRSTGLTASPARLFRPSG
ncbi:hypothetical protein FHS42_001283 [Streptomyces zagrosensis]|uniref:Uncharacterized protein n=1 Tax=Streptomyces zagrosensis TaxID=1042984 RepID=A0A7W9Q7Q0_9ACTN|nr:hypothetical protein [Streptomyces zagrosensis]